MFGPLLKIRDKIHRKRQALTEDSEKPFLEHLDDLRKTLMRMVITLLVAVIVCFVFNDWFFKLIQEPMRRAGLDQPKEFNLPASVKKISDNGWEQQAAWWRIHGTARGMADLEGATRESFIKTSAPDDFTRQFAWAMLLYNAADSLPKDKRLSWIIEASGRLPEGDREQVGAYAAELAEAGTSVSLEKPANSVEMEALAPPESFMLSMKLSLFAGVIVSFPLLFYFLLEFILPGLTSRERKMIFPALSIGFGLFLAGVAFAWYVVVPQTLEFFTNYSHDLGIRDNWRIGYFISFVTSFTLIFGLVFETPVVLMIMVKLGLLTSLTMRKSRGWAIIIIIVAAAVITPTGDILSLSLMAVPMIIMFEACIWLAWFHERKAAKREAEEQRRDEARRAALVGVASVQAARPEGEEEPASAPPEGEPSGDAPAAALPHIPSETEPAAPGVETVASQDQPHHPDTSTADDDYEQYLRDHAKMHSPAETHPESIPVEERNVESPPADHDQPPTDHDHPPASQDQPPTPPDDHR